MVWCFARKDSDHLGDVGFCAARLVEVRLGFRSEPRVGRGAWFKTRKGTCFRRWNGLPGATSRRSSGGPVRSHLVWARGRNLPSSIHEQLLSCGPKKHGMGADLGRRITSGETSREAPGLG